MTTPRSERDKDATRKRIARSESARIEIPPCRNPARRDACLADPERFMRTYFADRYRLQFGKDHRFIIQSVVDIATRGGKQAIAAPRGRGKSEVVKGLLVYLVAARLSRFIVAMAATTPLANRLFQDFKRKIANNDLLLEDFPEICWPVRCLEGAPQRAARQHVDGKLTRIVWASNYISLAYVPDSPYGGVKMAYSGLDAAFRGLNIDGDRPDLIVVDDPETKESANSEMQIEDRETMLNQDIAGLVGQDSTMGVAITSTVQNCYCLSARLTDPKILPAYNGKRFGLIESWPKNLELWDEYVSTRRANQQAGDAHGMGAVEFYLANRASMDEGVVMISDHYNQVETEDGRQTVYSAIQQAYNKIADTSLSAFKTEYQNDPDPEEEPETLNLKPGRIASQLSRIERGRLPEDDVFSFVGIDIGKHSIHWVKIASTRNATIWITDYGKEDVYGLTENSSERAIELAILKSLNQFADSDVFKTAQPLLALVDSGYCKESIYEFCKSAGRPFFPVKGVESNQFRQKKESKEYQPFLEAYSHRMIEAKYGEIWLYIINGEYWKKWGQERFLVDAFIDDTRIPGSAAIFDPPEGSKKFHLKFSQQLVSESEQLVPVNGKENKRVWIVHDRRNNHWLDAYGYACAAAGCAGIRIVGSESKPAPAPQVQPKPRAPIVNPYGQPFLATERK